MKGSFSFSSAYFSRKNGTWTPNLAGGGCGSLTEGGCSVSPYSKQLLVLEASVITDGR